MFKVSHINIEAAYIILDGIHNPETTHAGELTINKGNHPTHGEVALVCGSGEHCALMSMS